MSITPKPSAVTFKPQEQIVISSGTKLQMENANSSLVKKIEAPKPKPRDREKTHVTNTAFRDSEPLRELQRSLHRAENKKGKA